MQKLVVTLLGILAIGISCAGTLPPLTLRDVSLMLRSGYSSAAVTQELSARHFLGSVDSTSEKMLTQAGASTDLVVALRNQTYTLSLEQAAVAEKNLADKTRLRDLQAAQAQKDEAHYQSNVASNTNNTKQAIAPTGRIIDQLKGDLVTSSNGILHTFNDQALDKKKLIGLYFSAHWCGPCRKFTPTLVEYYNRVAAAHPEFELLFISGDRSESAMEEYMRDTQMPWPAVRFDKIAEKQAILKYGGAGIPCLVVIDSDGRVLSNTYDGKTYLGPSKVLNDLDVIFARGDANQVALRR